MLASGDIFPDFYLSFVLRLLLITPLSIIFSAIISLLVRSVVCSINRWLFFVVMILITLMVAHSLKLIDFSKASGTDMWYWIIVEVGEPFISFTLATFIGSTIGILLSHATHPFIARKLDLIKCRHRGKIRK